MSPPLGCQGEASGRGLCQPRPPGRALPPRKRDLRPARGRPAPAGAVREPHWAPSCSQHRGPCRTSSASTPGLTPSGPEKPRVSPRPCRDPRSAPSVAVACTDKGVQEPRTSGRGAASHLRVAPVHAPGCRLRRAPSAILSLLSGFGVVSPWPSPPRVTPAETRLRERPPSGAGCWTRPPLTPAVELSAFSDLVSSESERLSAKGTAIVSPCRSPLRTGTGGRGRDRPGPGRAGSVRGPRGAGCRGFSLAHPPLEQRLVSSQASNTVPRVLPGVQQVARASSNLGLPFPLGRRQCRSPGAWSSRWWPRPGAGGHPRPGACRPQRRGHRPRGRAARRLRAPSHRPPVLREGRREGQLSRGSRGSVPPPGCVLFSSFGGGADAAAGVRNPHDLPFEVTLLTVPVNPSVPGRGPAAVRSHGTS